MTKASPHPKVRATGVVYLLYLLMVISAAFFMKGLVVSGDAAATANNILAHESLFRAGFVICLIATALYLAMAALFYELFKPVNKSLSLLAAFSRSRRMRHSGMKGANVQRWEEQSVVARNGNERPVAGLRSRD
jgi:Domain of unknown function (DUF4386)